MRFFRKPPAPEPAPRRVHHPWNPPEAELPISLQFADGRTAATGRRDGDAEPPGPILQPRGGGGTSHFQLLRWWAWPLPPSGPLEFICRWPMYGITETRVSIEAQLILDAARRSVRPWAEDEN